jgi:hypothetical protein
VLAGRSDDRTVAAAAAVAAVAAMVQPIAFRGVQPKNWLTPGVWITAESAAMEPRLLRTTPGQNRRRTIVWVSRAPASAIVRVRGSGR